MLDAGLFNRWLCLRCPPRPAGLGSLKQLTRSEFAPRLGQPNQGMRHSHARVCCLASDCACVCGCVRRGVFLWIVPGCVGVWTHSGCVLA
ncbi:hypothetical protein ElyMa_001124900 [Elysia marginata]|uniref:Uncharacterized protein n=1 Tax=Elysia marginata TaxID=1093978 RepID=A0AAV4I1B3_9GAST|nr:hypothetical protein ElyMa_001124900 [Elysia marginata]